MTVSYSIRPANREEDGPAIGAAFTAARSGMTYLPSLHTPGEDIAYSVAATRYAQRVEVAEVDGAVVGFSLVHGGVLQSLYVRPEWQGSGIGSSLLARAQEASPEGLSLWVFEANRGARALYERNGFVEIDRTDGSGNEEGVPDIKMAWKGAAAAS